MIQQITLEYTFIIYSSNRKSFDYNMFTSKNKSGASVSITTTKVIQKTIGNRMNMQKPSSELNESGKRPSGTGLTKHS